MPGTLTGALHILFPSREKPVEKVNCPQLSHLLFHGLLFLIDFFKGILRVFIVALGFLGLPI